ncbi:MAG: DegT/DnrJ/EryC1/StrS aminotransferase family protein [Planctomycetes bacterium]|nr:DegT/DnrJ/EryC1/StrS aminotransferase family protein [Planctomycetota bacterium]
MQETLELENIERLDISDAPWPLFEEDEIAATERVLRSGRVNYWTGEENKLFEKEFAKSCGCPRGIALSNGTLALELALEALGVGTGDEVVVTCRSFVASASSIIRVGATPVFADVDMESQNVTAATIEKALTPKTRAVIVVHLAGWPCEMDAIMSLAESKGIYVIEDCAQAHGAKFKGKAVGSFGHMNAYSFCQDKIMTTGGEGGMLITSDESLFQKAWQLKEHGKSYDAVHNREHPKGFRWLIEDHGTNYRLSEMQAAIGRVQLTKLDKWVAARRRNAKILIDAIAGSPAARVPLPGDEVFHSYYKFYALLNPEALKAEWSADRVRDTISSLGAPCIQGSCPEIYLEKAYEEFAPSVRLPVAAELGERSMMLLVHHTLTEAHMARMGEIVRAVLDAAMR